MKKPRIKTLADRIRYIREEIRSAREDSSLGAQERVELIQDLRADLSRLLDRTPEEYKD